LSERGLDFLTAGFLTAEAAGFFADFFADFRAFIVSHPRKFYRLCDWHLLKTSRQGARPIAVVGQNTLKQGESGRSGNARSTTAVVDSIAHKGFVTFDIFKMTFWKSARTARAELEIPGLNFCDATSKNNFIWLTMAT
jgi:hypothetical protein